MDSNTMASIYSTTIYLMIIVIPISIICCCIGICRRYLCKNGKTRTTQMAHIVTVSGTVPSNTAYPISTPDADPIPSYLQAPPDYTEVYMPPPSYEEVIKNSPAYESKGTSHTVHVNGT